MNKAVNFDERARAQAFQSFELDLHNSLSGESYSLSSNGHVLVNQGYELWKSILNKHYPVSMHLGNIAFKRSSIYKNGYQILENFVDEAVCNDLRQYLRNPTSGGTGANQWDEEELMQPALIKVAKRLFEWQNHYLHEQMCLVPRSVHFADIPEGSKTVSQGWHFDFEQPYNSLIFMIHLNTSGAGTFILDSKRSMVVASDCDYLGFYPKRRVSSLDEINGFDSDFTPLFTPANATTTIVFQPGRAMHRHRMSQSGNKNILTIYASAIPKEFPCSNGTFVTHGINTIDEMIKCVGNAMLTKHRHEPPIYM